MDARELARRSQAAVAAKDRSAWLALFADDAVVQDPIGPSPLDPGGGGHRGAAAIAAEPEVSVWDLAARDILVREAGGAFTSRDGTAGPHGGSAVATTELISALRAHLSRV